MTSTDHSVPIIDGKDENSPTWFDTIKRLNFQERICSTFISQEIDRKQCVCNNLHHTSNASKSDEVWRWKGHTETKPTNCYGILPHSKSPYLRCDIDTQPDQLCLVLFGLWSIPTPSLIMRMIGDAISTLNIKLEKELLLGISEAAVASDAWIITSGYKEETISELIGEIVYKTQVKNAGLNFSAIAVGKWGNINECRKLAESANQTVKYGRPGRCTLEPNHTHYIFFDDGTYNSIDTGGFASKLARKISRGGRRRIPLVTILVGGNLHALKSLWNDLKKQIPVVIVDQSGPLANILCKYYKATKNISKPTMSQDEERIDGDENSNVDENDIDLFMLYHSFAKNDAEKARLSSRYTMGSLRKVLQPFDQWRLDIYNDLLKLYSVIRQEEYKTAGKKYSTDELLNRDEKQTFAQYVFWFAACLTSPLRDNIQIFDFDPSNSLQKTIYDASIQARKNLSATTNTHGMTVDDQIRLALHWSIPNITGDQLLTSTMDWYDPKKIERNQLLLLDALSGNLQVFVRNFVQLDIDLSVLFAPIGDKWGGENWAPHNYYLQQLYSKARRTNPDPLYLLDDIDQPFDFKEEKALNSVLNKFVGDIMDPLYEDRPKVKSSQVAPKRKPKTENRSNIESSEEIVESKINTDKRDVEYIYRDIFLWCVLTHRLVMAKIILGQMKTRICSALIASKILKSLAAYAPDHESKNRLCFEANIFEEHAIEFVRCSYLYNKQQACELIIREVKLYGSVTCLQMAIVADDKKFLDEDACQALLTHIWYDKEDPAQERTRLVINILTMGISQLFISLYEKQAYQTRMAKQGTNINELTPPKRRLAKYGIDYSDDYGIEASTIQHFFHFHNRPIIKYVYTCFGYILFLLFFSYFMLYAFDPRSDLTPDIHWTEILTIIFVTTMLFEEVRQFFFQDNRTLKGKLLSYFDWNNRLSNLCLVLPGYLLFYVGLILRFVLTDITDFSAARVVMAYDLEVWFIRAVLFIGIIPSLGPKLVMIRKMTNDLLLFIIIIVVFIFGYGITSRSMTAYRSFDFDGRQFFHNVVYPVYYCVLGSFDDERSQLDATPDDSTRLATQVMFAFHMLFVNILLLNLLIALFSNTINDVQTQADYIWSYDRCALIRDYYARPALFPPFTFLVSMVQFCEWCWQKCKRKKQKSRCFKMVPEIASYNTDLDNAWSEFERFSTNDHIRQLLDAQTNITANTTTTDIASELSSTNIDQSKWLKSDMNQLKDELAHSRTDTDDRLSSMESTVSNVKDRMDIITTQMTSFQDSLNWIMRAMERVKMDKDPPLLIQKSRPSVSNQGRAEMPENVQENRRTSTRRISQQQKDREALTTIDTSIDRPEKSDDYDGT